MLTSTDTLNTARAVLHRILYSPTSEHAAAVFSIEVCEQKDCSSHWSATIDIRECTSPPVRLTLNLGCLQPVVCGGRLPQPSFEMTASFEQADNHHVYWLGSWYKNGQLASLPGTVPPGLESLHPLAVSLENIVETTLTYVRFLHDVEPAFVSRPPLSMTVS